jgi:hypothetical protein
MCHGSRSGRRTLIVSSSRHLGERLLARQQLLEPHRLHQDPRAAPGRRRRTRLLRARGDPGPQAWLAVDKHFTVDGTLVAASASVKSFTRPDAPPARRTSVWRTLCWATHFYRALPTCGVSS